MVLFAIWPWTSYVFRLRRLLRRYTTMGLLCSVIVTVRWSSLTQEARSSLKHRSSCINTWVVIFNLAASRHSFSDRFEFKFTVFLSIPLKRYTMCTCAKTNIIDSTSSGPFLKNNSLLFTLSPRDHYCGRERETSHSSPIPIQTSSPKTAERASAYNGTISVHDWNCADNN